MSYCNLITLFFLHWLQTESRSANATGQVQMSTGQLLLTILGSAAVGALVSSVFTLIDRWRERTARERELLFRSALEISKATAERLAKTSERFTPALELYTLERTHAIVKQIYETGKMSEKDKAFLEGFIKKTE